MALPTRRAECQYDYGVAAAAGEQLFALGGLYRQHHQARRRQGSRLGRRYEALDEAEAEGAEESNVIGV